ncbi:hypothetical protein CPB83DRAFT_891894 [Crepidotus variabilis]|uniref:Uncharacterized protein n=1 Tax=Crepidotus variabilis TaxID=179855 RepID=A0A9P6EKP3_9AGAR|nr:hypothetical protein CPB83DRAFT_891894 [Crepidotus variabilis]
MPFSFAKPATVPIASSIEPLAPKPLFGVGTPNPLFGEASQAPLMFGDSSETTSPLHVPAVAPPQSTPSPLGYNFGSSAPEKELEANNSIGVVQDPQTKMPEEVL